MKSIVIFCGSSEGNNPIYKEVAHNMGIALAERGVRIIYGGAKVGLMGTVADAALQKGGEVVGVIPHFLRTKEVAHEGLTDLLLVDTMHERKMKMHELSDAAITLSGGFGTMEEMFEMLTWAQLGLHEKPIGLLNTNGYYDGLEQLCNTMVSEGFLLKKYRNMLLISDKINSLLSLMEQYRPPETSQWITEWTT